MNIEADAGAFMAIYLYIWANPSLNKQAWPYSDYIISRAGHPQEVVLQLQMPAQSTAAYQVWHDVLMSILMSSLICCLGGLTCCDIWQLHSHQ